MKRNDAVKALIDTAQFASSLLAMHQTYMAKPQSSLAGQHEEAHRRLDAGVKLVLHAEPEDEYQGWSNRETWTLGLWFSNEALHYAAMREIIERHGLTDFERANRLEDYAMPRFLRGLNGWQADMANCFLARVDWLEILKSNQEA